MPFTVVLALFALDAQPVVRRLGPPSHPLVLLTSHRRDAVEPARPLLDRGTLAFRSPK